MQWYRSSHSFACNAWRQITVGLLLGVCHLWHLWPRQGSVHRLNSTALLLHWVNSVILCNCHAGNWDLQRWSELVKIFEEVRAVGRERRRTQKLWSCHFNLLRCTLRTWALLGLPPQLLIWWRLMEICKQKRFKQGTMWIEPDIP